MDQAWAAVVGEADCDLEVGRARLRAALPQVEVQLKALEELPRSDRGKIRRDLLREWVSTR